MTTLITIARRVRPYTRKSDWVLISLAIWAVVIHAVVEWLS